MKERSKGEGIGVPTESPRRRQVLASLGSIGAITLAGCLGGDSGSSPINEADDPSSPETTIDQTPTPESGPQAVYDPQEEFEVDGVAYNVTEVTIGDMLYVGSTGYSAGEGAKIVRVRLEITNNGQESITLPLADNVEANLIDSQGREYERQRTLASTGEIGPGLSARTLFYFRVPEDQEERYLVIGSSHVKLVETATPTETKATSSSS